MPSRLLRSPLSPPPPPPPRRPPRLPAPSPRSRARDHPRVPPMARAPRRPRSGNMIPSARWPEVSICLRGRVRLGGTRSSQGAVSILGLLSPASLTKGSGGW